MESPGFWEDQRAAAKVSAERARTQRKIETFEQLEAEAGELDGMLELAAEDPNGATSWTRALTRLDAEIARLQEQALFTGEYDSGPAVVTVHAGAGGTDSQDWAEMLLRMYLRWADGRGFKAELVEADAGGGGGPQERHLHADRRERLRHHAGREGRAPAGAAVAVRLRPPPPHQLRPG